jgi:hypothetical protein
MSVILWKVGGRELKRQPQETEAQILQRRGTLLSLKIVDCSSGQPKPNVLCVMPYMTDMC